WIPPDDSELSLDVDGRDYEDQMNAEVFESSIFQDNTAKVQQSNKSKRQPHLVWKEQFKSLYLDEITRHDGRGDSRQNLKCLDCIAQNLKEAAQGEPEIHCKDCFLNDLVCMPCCVRQHRQNPFHCIERWTGLYFTATTLKVIGLHIQLNHQSLQCPIPVPCHVKLQILHMTGIHDIAVDYCGCERQIPQHIQLLRCGWYPA
ncbi:hypothetical protein ARMSODRAFT_862949, partial [Armillaria solidipes]